MFERPHHRRIARVLEGLDADLFLKSRCLFGGGTAIALKHGEYRESIDVDFICSSVDGYRELRTLVNRAGFDALFKTPLPLLRGPRIDMYGIRGAFSVDNVPIKLEILFEARVALSDPGPQDNICGVWTLTAQDLMATKLMANSDRWADDAVMSRDLIDLSMLTETGVLAHAAVAKAKHAYGDTVVSDFAKARERLLEREGRLKTCMEAMGISMPVDEMRARLERLRLEEDDEPRVKSSRRRRS